LSLITDVGALLTGVSNIGYGHVPTDPDNAVGIFNTGGYPRSLSGTQVEEPTFQVRVRNTSYSTGEALCCTIKDLLHGVNNSGKFLLIEQQGDTLDLGRDANNRAEFSMNFRTFYRR
jgi:hypothetical protein